MPSFLSSLARRGSSRRRSSDVPEEDPALRPALPYAVDFAASGTEGERIATKRHAVTWRFVFAHGSDGSDGGESGEMEEHEVALDWDWNARRRFVRADGREVSREISRAAVCDTSWEMEGGRKVRLVAHAFAKNDRAGFRQYDLFVDGVSFFEFPKRRSPARRRERRQQQQQLEQPDQQQPQTGRREQRQAPQLEQQRQQQQQHQPQYTGRIADASKRDPQACPIRPEAMQSADAPPATHCPEEDLLGLGTL